MAKEGLVMLLGMLQFSLATSQLIWEPKHPLVEEDKMKGGNNQENFSKQFQQDYPRVF